MARYSDSTTQMTVSVEDAPLGATVLVSSHYAPEGLPIWTPRGGEQRDALVKELKSAFGDTAVAVARVDESTDRRISVDADAAKVTEAVQGFVSRHQIELDVGDDHHFRDVVRGATQQKLRDGIRGIIGDPLLDTNQKTDAVMDLLRHRRDQRRGGRE